MNTSSDILSLFKIFGGRPEQYQEVSGSDTESPPQERWPGIEKISPRQATDKIEPVPHLHAVGSQDAKVPFPLPEPSFEEHASRAPLRGEPSLGQEWSSASLQSLLSQMPREEGVATVVAAPTPAPTLVKQRRPDLSNIRVLSVISAKGGVGKSTLSANLGAALRRLGHAVLLVDLDPQDALQHHFEVPAEHAELKTGQGIAAIARNEMPWRQLCLPSTSGVFVLPHGYIDETYRSIFEKELERDPYWLGRHLEELQLSDGAVVILDTPPGPSIYLRQALSVTNIAIVASLSDAASYTAMSMADNLIRAYTKGRNDFEGAYYLVNQVDRARQLNKDIAQIMSNILGDQLLGVIHRDQSVSEALAYNRTAIDYDPHGQGCQDFLTIAEALSEKLATPIAQQHNA